ncbi:ricin-type beta-trefoil lectin domain protein [Usitatibacter palustris]|uniref:Ricin B lectin domain-containing protein n=1 Tax=Usitatibacter palustris TaxID=2732487 RepID=A0A6M4HAM1_9PROT|nr:ricin-type beta-trefoil lectin domain protein [Usitatibacter palustris]QJR15713.1 hypothetical protein DSM104440_02539 [Usitatibacter palustris]
MHRLPALRLATFALIAAFAGGADAQLFSTSAPNLSQVKYVTKENADTILKPGDIMFKRLNDSSPATTIGISISETLIQNLHGTLGSGEAAAGDPKVVHVAMYLGGGQTAEAHGETPGESAGVSLRPLSKHAGFLWFVVRPVDQALAKEAVAIARTWATGRMGYALPLTVPLSDSSFGPKARTEALEYGRAANVAGGPPGMSKMFCSQFILAVYQAAVVQRQLAKNSKLNADQVTMISGVDRQPSNTSPLVMHGRMMMTRIGVEWDRVGWVVTQNPPAEPRLGVPVLPSPGGPAQYQASNAKCLIAVPQMAGFADPKVVVRQGSPIVTGQCGAPGSRWELKDGRLLADKTLCLSVNDGRMAPGSRLILWGCHGGADQRWTYSGKALKLTDKNLCAEVVPMPGTMGIPVLADCKATVPAQAWTRNF